MKNELFEWPAVGGPPSLVLPVLLECWGAANVALMSTVNLHESTDRQVLQGQSLGTSEKG